MGFQKKVTKMNKTATTSAITARIMKTRTKLIQLPTWPTNSISFDIWWHFHILSVSRPHSFHKPIERALKLWPLSSIEKITQSLVTTASIEHTNWAAHNIVMPSLSSIGRVHSIYGEKQFKIWVFSYKHILLTLTKIIWNNIILRDSSIP